VGGDAKNPCKPKAHELALRQQFRKRRIHSGYSPHIRRSARLRDWRFFEISAYALNDEGGGGHDVLARLGFSFIGIA
jgi:hypothetical protein